MTRRQVSGRRGREESRFLRALQRWHYQKSEGLPPGGDLLARRLACAWGTAPPAHLGHGDPSPPRARRPQPTPGTAPAAHPGHGDPIPPRARRPHPTPGTAPPAHPGHGDPIPSRARRPQPTPDTAPQPTPGTAPPAHPGHGAPSPPWARRPHPIPGTAPPAHPGHGDPSPPQACPRGDSCCNSVPKCASSRPRPFNSPRDRREGRDPSATEAALDRTRKEEARSPESTQMERDFSKPALAASERTGGPGRKGAAPAGSLLDRG
ncbi:BUD13 homolog [Penaeus vannamei]|uniref:BUD13 homolog n=1 Tax=Penaeus vannamei TaxID=6689 RepID=UPI00387F79EA